MLKLQHLTKRFGTAPLFTDLCMEVDAPVVLWAPSGWGKTTLLRILMGLERPTTGSVEGVGRVAAVFQEDRLCPQLNAVQNVTLVLPGAENQYKEQITSDFQQIGMDTAALQLPARRLSGGQKQRVAIGAAIIRQPKAFLMDEPLSNLDAKLRTQMRVELQKLHKQLHTTIIYVTHDQTEAMTLGTKIVVMKDGMIQQVDTPKNIYNHPVNKFVAGFVGSPSMNFIECEVAEELGKTVLFFGTKGLVKKVYPTGQNEEVLRGNYMRKRVILGIRSEDIYALEEAEKKGLLKNSIGIKETVINREMLGAEIMLYFEEQDRTCAVRLDPSNQTKVWEEIDLYFDMEKIHIFDIDTEENILYRGR